MIDCTRRVGIDTIRLNWDIGSDPTVHRFPSEHEWYGNKPLPPPRRVNPLQINFQLRCVEVEAYGGGTQKLKDGSIRLWRRQDGVFYQLDRGQYRNRLSLETSLPKLLWGHNRAAVPLDQLCDAFSELTRRGRSFIPSLPPCDELEAWRIDATADTLLHSEIEIGLVGRVLGECSLNGAMPVRYPSGGSMHWPASKGFPGARCYGKFAESGGHEKTVGQYRAEVVCMGGRQFRKALDAAVAAGDLSPEWVSGRSKRCVRGGTLVTEPKLCTALLGGLTGLLDAGIELVREGNNVTALQAIELLEQKAGLKRARAVQLIGYAHIVRVLGWNYTSMDRTNIWRAKKAFELAGIDPAEIEFTSAEKLRAGGRMVVASAVLAGAAGAAAVTGAVIGSALADATFPDPPKPVDETIS